MAAGFFHELKRRNVFRVAIAYIFIAWLLLQVADVLFGMLDVPLWAGRLLVAFLILGFPLAIFFAWVFELTPEGLKLESQVERTDSVTRQTGRKLDRLIIALLLIAVAYFSVDKFLLSPAREAQAPSQTTDAISTDAGPDVGSTGVTGSIAVLPFANMSGDPEQEYFSDGLSEELLNVLARMDGLRVAARTSSFAFKDTDLTANEIAEKLEVEHVLEGSVRKSGNRVRITAQLIKAADGFNLWSETYDRELSDIFEIQADIAAAISGALQSQLGLAPEQLIPEQVVRTSNTQAYEAFLKGRQLIHLRGRDNLEEAVRLLERSLRLDNSYAPAHAQLAIATAMLTADPTTYGDLSIAEVERRAMPHITRAIELAPQLSEAYGARCLLRSLQDRYDDAALDCERAMALNPSSLDAMNWAATNYLELGQYADVVRLTEEIFQRDPASIIGRYNYSDQLYGQGRIGEAIAVAQSMMEDSPWAAYHTLGIHQVVTTGDLPSGIRNSLFAFALEPQDFGTVASLARGLTYLGLETEAARLGENVAFLVAFLSGDYAGAINIAENNISRDSATTNHKYDLASALHRSGQIDASRQIYESLAASKGLRILLDPVNRSATPMLRLAHARHVAGDQPMAEQAIAAVEQDLAMRREAGFNDRHLLQMEAQLAALQGNIDSAIRSLDEAVNLGLREAGFLNEPVFETLRDDPRMLELRQKLASILAKQREETLRIICLDNPVSDTWQPLPETCVTVTP